VVSDTIRLACCQLNVTFGDPIANAGQAVAQLVDLARRDVQLAVFPECYLTGYCVRSLEAAQAIAIATDHVALKEIRTASQETGCLAIVGFAERHPDGSVSNSAALFEPGSPPRFYRKSHLPFLGLDRFVTPGDALDVFETAIGRIGILICYDQRAPEPARVLALKGADVIVLPTNWPVGAETSAEVVAPTRAAENRVFYAACNRTGTEHGFTFIGRSGIYDPVGTALARAEDGEAVLIADLDLAQARSKRTVNIPGEYEMAIFDSRRPELYGRIVE